MFFWHLGLTPALILLTLGRRRIDYRVVLLGAILPDLIDKPVGRIFFEDTFQNSRLFAHTLAFVLALLLFVIAFLRGASARRWFVLPVAVLIHLALDAMWAEPVTLFWPLFSFEFPKVFVEDYWLAVLTRPFDHPVEALKEFIGLAVLMFMGFVFSLQRRDQMSAFLRTGELPSARGDLLREP